MKKVLNTYSSKNDINIKQIVAYKDNILEMEEYRDGFTKEDTMNVMSVTKSVTSLLVGIAIDQGLIKSVDDFVIIACDDMKERKRITNLCRERHILVNSVDDIENCDFIFPSLIQRGKLSIGVMTGGASPVIGMDLKKQIMELIPDNIEEILEYMEKIRPEMKEKYPDEKERAKVFREIYKSMI